MTTQTVDTLPLAQKAFLITDTVQDVTVTDANVLVPKIAADDTGEDTGGPRYRAIDALVALCKEGYPYAGPVRKYISTYCPWTGTVMQYDKNFGFSKD